MAVTYPLPLADLSDVLRAKTCVVRLERFDEYSGSGDGRFWSASMAKPLWRAEIVLADRTARDARRLEAKINALRGSSGTFLFSDPSYPGPAYGNAMGGVTVSAVSSDRDALSLAGFPANFEITAGDRLSITHSSGKRYYGEFVEDKQAGSGGSITGISVEPELPFGVAAGDVVKFARPEMIVAVIPDGYTPFTYDLPNGDIARGGKLVLRQKP